jgi:uncharacterized protein
MDMARVMSPEKLRFLADGLVGFRESQQREVSVLTVPDLQGYDIEAFARRLAIEWGLEDSRNDDGAVLIVAPNELKVTIAVGSAVRPLMPEAVVRDIIDAQVVPSFRQGEMDNGILNGAGSILIYLELTPEEAAALAERQRHELAQAEKSDGVPWAGLAILASLLVFGVSLRRAGDLFGVAFGAIGLLGRDGGSASGGGFGGFGGGGSGFSGGGASGRW